MKAKRYQEEWIMKCHGGSQTAMVEINEHKEVNASTRTIQEIAEIFNSDRNEEKFRFPAGFCLDK